MSVETPIQIAQDLAHLLYHDADVASVARSQTDSNVPLGFGLEPFQGSIYRSLCIGYVQEKVARAGVR